ncbi:preprotein translocase subunit SecE [Persephonella sp.]
MSIGEAVKFLKEVREELKKVTWPSKQLVRTATIAVIIFTLIVAVYLWGLDILFDRIFNFLYK